MQAQLRGKSGFGYCPTFGAPALVDAGSLSNPLIQESEFEPSFTGIRDGSSLWLEPSSVNIQIRALGF
jgi:hypothetical protein